MDKKNMINLARVFIGYATGRVGHILMGYNLGFHHWIYALIIIGIPLFLRKNYKYGEFLLFFGIGLFISDLSDFINFRVYGIDNVDRYSFWGID